MKLLELNHPAIENHRRWRNEYFKRDLRVQLGHVKNVDSKLLSITTDMSSEISFPEITERLFTEFKKKDWFEVFYIV